MFKYILETSGDLSTMALIPLVLFFILFVAISAMALIKNKKYIDYMSNLPFEDSHSENAETK